MVEFLTVQLCFRLNKIGKMFSDEVFSVHNLMMSPSMRNENILRKYYENSLIMVFLIASNWKLFTMVSMLTQEWW
ncbi:hypothetical protein EPI10_031807 [Gossypium australe]|uniref:Uncharacterized protein n=1 Tax=Gossypium australe TaxID=47621 RepID=A0A5B6X4G4_9ROSI|nr:hypothetical protein EPI10_031807 [Gossypium australe]